MTSAPSKQTNLMINLWPSWIIAMNRVKDTQKLNSYYAYLVAFIFSIILISKQNLEKQLKNP